MDSEHGTQKRRGALRTAVGFEAAASQERRGEGQDRLVVQHNTTVQQLLNHLSPTYLLPTEVLLSGEHVESHVDLKMSEQKGEEMLSLHSVLLCPIINLSTRECYITSISNSSNLSNFSNHGLDESD